MVSPSFYMGASRFCSVAWPFVDKFTSDVPAGPCADATAAFAGVDEASITAADSVAISAHDDEAKEVENRDATTTSSTSDDCVDGARGNSGDDNPVNASPRHRS